MSSRLDRNTVNLVTLSIMALIVGCVTGLGAVVLRGLMALFHNVFFLQEFSFVYDANQLTPASPLGPWIILVPVIGGLGTVFLVRNFAPEAKGHGVPEVMNAVYYNEGRIRPSVVVVKSLASALSIGTGAAVGREGPIIQIGSAIGSTLGQLWKLRNWQTITLVAAGAGAGIAATFNTPLGGLMFAIELMLPEVSARTFLPVVLATGTATYIGRIFFGMEPAFLVPVLDQAEALAPTTLGFLPIYMLVGVLCGVASWLFIKVLYGCEDFFERLPVSPYLQSAIGMTGIGVLLYVLLLTVGNYYVDGVGYGTIQAILTSGIAATGLLAILFCAKLVATSVSLGAGASGGIFSPSLFLGATLGGAFGAVLATIWPQVGFNAIQFAVIGMGAVVGGTTGAAMTAIFMIFEMTGDYTVIVPLIVAVACAVGVRRMLLSENIYTLKLMRRGLRIPKDRHTNMFLVRHATDVMQPIVSVADLDARGGEAAAGPDAPGPDARGTGAGPQGPGYHLVVRGRHIVGVHPPADPTGSTVGALQRRFVVARETDIMNDVLRRMAERGRNYALVVRCQGVPHVDDVIGVIGRAEIADQLLDQFHR